MLIYAHCPIIFDVPPQWTDLGLFLGSMEQIWCVYSVILHLSVVPVISG